MKKIIYLCIVLVFIAALGVDLYSQDDEDVLKGTKVKKYPFFIYKDSFYKQNHFIASGWMGDFGDIKYKDKWKKNVKTGKSCIRVKYTAEKKQGAGWAGIYWQNPANNWGTSLGGFDLSKSKKVFFYAKGDKGGEIVEFKVGGIASQYSDSAATTTGIIELTKKWKLYEIDMEGLDLSYINGGFCIVFSSTANPDGCIFYMDEIYYSDKKKPNKIK